MAIQTATATTGDAVKLTNSQRDQYNSMYENEVYFQRFYDQLAVAVPTNDEGFLASNVQYRFLSKMNVGTTNISEVSDITPQALKDATASIAPVSRGEALQISELIELKNYLTNYMPKMTLANAENAAESIDFLAMTQAVAGSLVERTVARASLDAGTTGHRLTEQKLLNAANRMAALKAPMWVGSHDGSGVRRWGAFMDPFSFSDLRRDGHASTIGDYQRAGIHLNWELGELGNFRLVVNPWAKIFYGAGVNNASAVDTTLAAATTKLAKTLTVAANTNVKALAAGDWVNIATEETANTHYTDNERAQYVSYTGSTITIVGEAPNGGLRFSHASGETVNNSDSVHTIVCGGPGSLVKMYAVSIGPYGQIVGPKRDGILDQFWTLGWKFYGNYGRVAENRLIRIEVSVSDEA